jgi:hypothetical protein
MRQFCRDASDRIEKAHFSCLFSLPKKMTRRFITAGSGKGLIGHWPKSLRVASWVYARISEILLDGSDISPSETVSFMTFPVMKCHKPTAVMLLPQ